MQAVRDTRDLEDAVRRLAPLSRIKSKEARRQRVLRKSRSAAGRESSRERRQRLGLVPSPKKPQTEGDGDERPDSRLDATALEGKDPVAQRVDAMESNVHKQAATCNKLRETADSMSARVERLQVRAPLQREGGPATARTWGACRPSPTLPPPGQAADTGDYERDRGAGVAEPRGGAPRPDRPREGGEGGGGENAHGVSPHV